MDAPLPTTDDGNAAPEAHRNVAGGNAAASPLHHAAARASLLFVEIVGASCVSPGRMRFHLRELRYNEAAARELKRLLSAHASIRTAQASALTGTLLIEFDPLLTNASVATMVEDALEGRLAVASGAGTSRRTSSLPESVKGKAAALHQWLQKLTNPGSTSLVSAAAQANAAVTNSYPIPSYDGCELYSPPAPWHALSTVEAMQHLGVGPSGLQPVDVALRLTRIGLNILPVPEPRSMLTLIWSQVRSLPVLLLIGSAALSILTGSVIDGVVIAAVVLLNTTIGVATERHAERTIATLSKLEEPETLVIRQGRVLQVNAARVAVGDVIPLTRSAYIAADARIIEARSLTIAESALTGESAPVNKITHALPTAAPLADRRNMVYRGTVVTGGSGIAVVVATGTRTEIGCVHALINQASRPETPMEVQLNRLGRQTAVAAAAVFALTLGMGYLRGFGSLETLRSALSLAVAALPEGLPSMATAALAIGMLRMRRQNVLARSLGAVETIGAVNLLCLDKTGTLTMNRMSAVEVYAGRQRLPLIADQSLLGAGDLEGDPEKDPHLNMLLAVCALCSEAKVAPDSPSPEFEGSATEVALLDLVQASHLDVAQLRRRFPLLELHPRAEGRNFMITLHGAAGGRRLVAIKGSPEEVLRRCKRRANSAGVRALSQAERKGILKENNRLASQARRVLGTAYVELQPGEEGSEATENFIWLGLVALADPPREGAREAIRALHRAGIATRMVTGDQGATANAIGREIGLFGEDEEVEIWDASASPDDSPRAEHIERSRIFSRVSPSHKLEIVQALQRFGHVVAMTGDGINDGPALKAADVGVALGNQSTDTARESADLLLRNDDLRCLLSAVREGRAVHHNLREAVRFLVATNLSEVFSVLGAVGLGIGQPLTSRQLLWLNLVTDIFPVLALAVEPPRPGILDAPPPNPNQPLISRRDLPLLAGESALIAGAVGTSYVYALRRYGSGAEARTMAFLCLTTAQLLHTLATGSRTRQPEEASSLRNNYVPLAVAGSFALELLTMFTPLRSLLGLAPLALADFGVCAASVGLSSLATYILRTLHKPEDSDQQDCMQDTAQSDTPPTSRTVEEAFAPA